MRRFLAPVVLLLLGAVAPATPGAVPAGQDRAGVESGEALLIYESRPGDTLQRIAGQWLLPVADLGRLQLLNGVSASAIIAAGTPISIPEAWVRTEVTTATLAAFRGTVQVIRNNESRAAAKGAVLREGDQIETGPNGFVTLVLPDDSQVSLPSASRIAIERLRQVPLTDSLDRRFRLLHGRSDLKVTPMANPASRFLIQTPVAVAAVRGTRYRVSFMPAEMRAVTEVTEGRVEVRLADGSSSLLLEAGFAAVATATGLRGPLALPGRPLVAVRGRIQTGDEVTFRLRPTPGIASYQVELAADAGFLDRLASATTSTGMVVFHDLPDGHYHARAYLVGAEGVRGQPADFEFDRRFGAASPTAAGLSAALPAEAGPSGRWLGLSSWVTGGGASGIVSGATARTETASRVVTTGEAGRLAEDASPLAAPQRQPFGASFPDSGGAPGGWGISDTDSGSGFPVEGAGGTDSGQSGGQSNGLGGLGGQQIPDAGIVIPIPEPHVWLLLLSGFGLVGGTVRLRRHRHFA